MVQLAAFVNKKGKQMLPFCKFSEFIQVLKGEVEKEGIPKTAQRAGVSYNTIHRALFCNSAPRYASFEKIVEYLNARGAQNG